MRRPCRHSVTGATADLPAAVLPAWRALGWVPLDEPAEQPASQTPDEAAQQQSPPEETKSAAGKRAAKSEE